MSLFEIIGLLVVLGLLAVMVLAARRAATDRKGQDSVDSGSSWRADFGDGDGGGD